MGTFARVYEIVSAIPKGKVATYKLVSTLSGANNPRLVGFALHANKDPVPCHRVVKSNGALAKGYAFGKAKKQKEKLEQEGITFVTADIVDLTKHLFTR